MRIAFIDVLGLAYDGSTLHKRGLGGSESAVIYMAESLFCIGHIVDVYNDCEADDAKPGNYLYGHIPYDKYGVNYKPLKEIENITEPYDVVIVSRSVAPFCHPSIHHQFKSFSGPLPDFTKMLNDSKYKVLWMHDTFCDGDQYVEDMVVNGYIDDIFTLSDFHTSYVLNADHGKKRMFEVLKNNIFMTRNGIRIHELSPEFDIENKDRNLFVYNASVTKGMIPLLEDVWPRVKERIPEAKLRIIGGYYRLRDSSVADGSEIKWRELVQKYESQDIIFTGVITQKEVAQEVAKATFMIYPADHPETFGISTLESLAYNTPVITCDFGALEETAIDSACYKIPYPIVPNNLFPYINKEDQIRKFVDMVVYAHSNEYLLKQKRQACNEVKTGLCSWAAVAMQWNQQIHHKLGEYLDVHKYRNVMNINHGVRNLFNRKWMNKVENVDYYPKRELPIRVIVTFHNAEEYIEKCIQSILSQDYDNYKILIYNDCSSDNSNAIVKKYYNMYSKIYYFEGIFHTKSALGNQISTIMDINDIDPDYGDGIIILVDGDDSLVNDPNIFNMYNKIYQTQALDFTYGSCQYMFDNIDLIGQDMKGRFPTNFPWIMPYSHLRTFRHSIFSSFDHDNLKDDEGQYFGPGGDLALFYELCRVSHYGGLPVRKVVYNYNDKSDNNDYKINSEIQNKNVQTILKRMEDKNNA